MYIPIVRTFEEIVLTFMTVMSLTEGFSLTDDMCNLKVIGKSDSHGVQHLQTSCQEGKIDWIDPRGGLELKFERPENTRLCLSFSVMDTTLHVYYDMKIVQTITSGGGSDHTEYCISSDLNQDHVSLEAWKPGVDADVSIEFIIEVPVSIEDECRPCTPEETIKAFCTLDIVVAGNITSMESTHTQTVLTVQATTIYRQNKPIFKTHTTPTGETTTGLLYRPLKCGTKYGDEEFLFVGRVRFGSTYISCAPLLVDWERIKTGKYHRYCYLD